MTGPGRDRAVVLGGSIAGLLAARVLADTYAEVVVVERDELPAGAAHRRGVPQGRHVHGLLAGGLQALEELFPGLSQELVAAGVPAGDMLGDTRLHFGGQRFRPGPSGLTALFVSRPALEAHLRARVRGLGGVTFLDRCDVAGLAATPDRRRIRGIRLIRRLDGSAEETLPADLVVDATGRGSRLPAWLADLGYPQPSVDQVRIGVGYASRTYRLTPDALYGALTILTAPTPDRPRGGALSAMEGGRYILTLFGILGDHPPTDPTGFTDFAAGLPFPDISEVVRDAEPLDEPVAFRFPASTRRRYERVSSFPDGLLVTGDALASFNPVYGQGMSVAALQALTLARHLQREPQPRPLRYLREAGRTVDVAWDLATGADLAFPGVRGRRTARLRMINRYVVRVQAAAADDPAIGRAFLRVTALVAPPQSLLAPAVAARVARHAIGGPERPRTDRTAQPIGG